MLATIHRINVDQHLAGAWAQDADPRSPAAYVAAARPLPGHNDDHGHAAGDDVLVVVAGRLAEACRAGDFLARLHGDEFVVVAIGIDSDAAAFADRLQLV